MRGTANAVSGSRTTRWARGLTTAVVFVAAAAAVSSASAATSLPTQVWAIKVSPRTATAQYLKGARTTGVNAVIVDAASFPRARLAATVAAASAARMTVIVTGGSCRALPARAVCAAKASSVPTALALARPGARPVVVTLTSLARLGPLARAQSRVVALVAYGLTANPEAWDAAMDAARSSKTLDLAVAPPAKGTVPAARAFPGAPNAPVPVPVPVPVPTPTPAPSPAPPSAPGSIANLRAGDVGSSTVTLTWDAPSSGAPVDHYEVFANNVLVGRVAVTRAT